jgi:hypothetical protein
MRAARYRLLKACLRFRTGISDDYLRQQFLGRGGEVAAHYLFDPALVGRATLTLAIVTQQATLGNKLCVLARSQRRHEFPTHRSGSGCQWPVRRKHGVQCLDD